MSSFQVHTHFTKRPNSRGIRHEHRRQRNPLRYPTSAISGLDTSDAGFHSNFTSLVKRGHRCTVDCVYLRGNAKGGKDLIKQFGDDCKRCMRKVPRMKFFWGGVIRCYDAEGENEKVSEHSTRGTRDYRLLLNGQTLMQMLQSTPLSHQYLKQLSPFTGHFNTPELLDMIIAFAVLSSLMA